MSRETIHHDPSRESRTLSRVGELWKRHRFPGDPPPPGSPAEERLISVAKEYIDTVLAEKKIHTDSANTWSNSEGKRRKLHNQLGIMIFGQARSGMDHHLAVALSDFATELEYPGMTLEQLEEVSELGKAEE